MLSDAKNHHLYFKAKKLTVSYIWKILRFFILFGLCVVILYPLLIMITIAVRPTADLYNPLVVWVPTSFTLANFIEVIQVTDYFNALGNTAFLEIIPAVLQTIACGVIGYGFARFKFKGKNILFFLVILSIVIPPQTYSIPGYLNFKALHLLDSFLCMYLPAIFGNGIRSGISIFIFRQFFCGLPRELEEAAYIDGCNSATTFIKIIIPNTGPAVLTVSILSIVWYWNDYYFASMFFSKANTLSVNLTKLHTLVADTAKYVTGTDPYLSAVLLEAGCLLALLPILIMYIILQKHFTESITSCGIVG